MMSQDTLRQVMPVVISVIVIVTVAALRSYSKTLAAITATMPVNIPLSMWIVYAAEHGDRKSTAQFGETLLIGLIATTSFTVVMWLAARAGLKFFPMMALSYLTWGLVAALTYLVRTYAF